MADQKIVTETALQAIASDIKDALNTKADTEEVYNLLPTDTASGSIAHFTDGADNIPVKSLVSQIVAVETGSGEKSPDNPYTISGFDSGVITRCGKNLIDTSLCTNRTADGITTTLNSNGSIHLNGTASSSSRWWRANADLTILLKAGTYTVSTNVSDVGLTLFTSESYKSGTFTLTRDVLVTNLIFRLKVGINYNVDVFPQLEVGNQATPYEPFNGNTYTFAFGQTVYGGHFNNKGNLVIAHGYILVDGSENFTMGTAVAYRYFDMSMANPLNVNAWETDIISNIFKKQGQGYPYCQINGTKKIRFVFSINDTSVTSVADLQALLTNTNAQIVYPLATPITLAITSQDIPTLLGENNFYSNTGDVDVIYRADIGLYIDKKLNS